MSSENWIALSPEPLDSASAAGFVSTPKAGGVAVFLGTTRAETSPGGLSLLALDYEAYAEMAGPQLADLARRARERWPVIKLVLLHRTGRVALGEPSVVIAVSTPHRAESFDACRWLIDMLKAEVAIWKKEVWDDGSGTWIHP
ncbi:MAG: moaE [Phycisphaerales bacterium]|nr:moaE [Phycisphaerales bacterium]